MINRLYFKVYTIHTSFLGCYYHITYYNTNAHDELRSNKVHIWGTKQLPGDIQVGLYDCCVIAIINFLKIQNIKNRRINRRSI